MITFLLFCILLAILGLFWPFLGWIVVIAIIILLPILVLNLIARILDWAGQSRRRCRAILEALKVIARAILEKLKAIARAIPGQMWIVIIAVIILLPILVPVPILFLLPLFLVLISIPVILILIAGILDWQDNQSADSTSPGEDESDYHAKKIKETEKL